MTRPHIQSRQQVAPQVGHDRDEDPRGLCADDPDMWYSDSLADKMLAQSVCRQCPFIAACLAASEVVEGGKEASGRFGIWAGLTPEQRATITRKNQRTARKEARA